MRKPIQIISLFLILIMLSACGTTPAETTPPSTTAPAVTEPAETTVPPTTEPPIPEGFVCLNEMFEGSDITITIEGSDIILDEDGLIIKMSTEKTEIFRSGYIAGVMKDTPIVRDDKVYINDDFFIYFFCDEDSNQVSMFYTIDFFPHEVHAAVESPDASPFNTKVYAEVLLPQSMGITASHINMNRVFNKTLSVHSKKYPLSTLERFGYNYYYSTGNGNKRYYVDSELDAIYHSIILKKTSGYNTDKINTDYLSEDYLSLLEQKGIDPSDYDIIRHWYPDDFADVPDEELRELIETHYFDDIDSLVDPIPPEPIPWEPAPITDAEINAMNAYFEGMDMEEIRHWFFDFSVKYHIRSLPQFSISTGPSTDATAYLPWADSMAGDDGNGKYKLYRHQVDHFVATYLGVTLSERQTLSSNWMYNRNTGAYYYLFTIGGFVPGPNTSHYLVDRMDISDGICTIHATHYFPKEDNRTEDAKVMKAMAKGDTTGMYPQETITVSFKLNPDTMEPVFCSFVIEYPD